MPYDWSLKILVPFGSLSEDDKFLAKNLLHDLDITDEIFDCIPLTKGNDVFTVLIAGMVLFEEIAKRFHLKEKDYVYCFELENANETCIFFDTPEYMNYIKKYGLPYSHKEYNKSDICWLRDYPNLHFVDLRYSIIKDFIGSCFGFRSDKILNIWYDSNKRVIDRK